MNGILVFILSPLAILSAFPSMSLKLYLRFLSAFTTLLKMGKSVILPWSQVKLVMQRSLKKILKLKLKRMKRCILLRESNWSWGTIVEIWTEPCTFLDLYQGFISICSHCDTQPFVILVSQMESKMIQKRKREGVNWVSM